MTTRKLMVYFSLIMALYAEAGAHEQLMQLALQSLQYVPEDHVSQQYLDQRNR